MTGPAERAYLAVTRIIDAAKAFDFGCDCPNCIPLRAALAALDQEATA